MTAYPSRGESNKKLYPASGVEFLGMGTDGAYGYMLPASARILGDYPSKDTWGFVTVAFNKSILA